MSAPDFWDNREKAQADVEEVSSLRNKIQPLEAVDFAFSSAQKPPQQEGRANQTR